MTSKENITRTKILMALARIENALADIDNQMRDLHMKLCNKKKNKCYVEYR